MEDLVTDIQDKVDIVKGAVATGAGWASDKVAQWKGIESKWVRVGIFIGVFLAVAIVLSVVQGIAG